MTNLIKAVGFNTKHLPEPLNSKVKINNGNIVISEESENLISSIHLINNQTVVFFDKTKFDNEENNQFFFLFDKKINNIEELKKEDLVSLLNKNDIIEAVVISNRGNSIQKKSMLEFNYRNNSTKSDSLISLISEHIDCDLLNFPKEVKNRTSKPKT
tara:strand:+ start:403 stop:873 length:471 start_codon:yes stop_codon:yes gene_type:complete